MASCPLGMNDIPEQNKVTLMLSAHALQRGLQCYAHNRLSTLLYHSKDFPVRTFVQKNNRNLRMGVLARLRSSLTERPHQQLNGRDEAAPTGTDLG